MINEYDAAASYPLMIFLNIDKSGYPAIKHRTYMERAIEAASALCLRASGEKQETGIIFYMSCHEGGISVIMPSAFTLVPILECLAAADLSAVWNTTQSVPDSIGTSAMTMLKRGKYLSYGTRYVYIGPDLGDEAYINLNLLKKHHLSLEYLIIDEHSMPSMVPGNSPCYQIKEQGFEIV